MYTTTHAMHALVMLALLGCTQARAAPPHTVPVEHVPSTLVFNAPQIVVSNGHDSDAPDIVVCRRIAPDANNCTSNNWTCRYSTACKTARFRIVSIALERFNRTHVVLSLIHI